MSGTVKPSMLQVKICGLSTPETLDAAINAGADMVGLVHVSASPRYVDLARASALSAQAKGRASRVVLLVAPDDELITSIVASIAPDMIQLHGQETPRRVAAIKALSGLPVMKAIGVANVADLTTIDAYVGIADHILIDAKPPKDAAYPGGHGRPFDWSILAALDPALRFMLSGGLTPGNVAEAVKCIRELGARIQGVDVSSGVEHTPGVKDIGLISDFVAAVRTCAELAKEPGNRKG
jgi:phosphoribosylanthranilate isomerase